MPLSLGVVPVINAAAAQSRLGGSTLSPGVRAAMDAAARSYVDLEELHDAVGARLATLTRAEAACVTCGSAAGIMVVVAALLAGDDRDAAAALPPTPSAQIRRVAVWADHLAGRLAGTTSMHANGYLASVRMAGAQVRAVADPDELRASDLAVLWFPRMFPHDDEDEVFRAFVSGARSLGIPVVVDAADQVPPRANLWRYTTELGADAAIFSGGKGLGGPTTSGLVVGRAGLIAACRANSGPEHSVGRPAKVGREQLAGLLAAVEETLAADETAAHDRFARVVEQWADRLRDLGWTLRTTGVSHSGQPIPRLVLEPPGADTSCGDDLVRRLWDGRPRVAVLPEGAGIALNPHLVRDDEVASVAAATRAAVAAHTGDCRRCLGRT